MTIVEFLTARLDEREALARAASLGPWKVDDEEYAEAIYEADGFTTVVAGGRWGDEASIFNHTADALFIAANDPAYVLADIAAKRALIAAWDGHPEDYEEPDSIAAYVLRALAQPFANHPDFDPAWKD